MAALRGEGGGVSAVLAPRLRHELHCLQAEVLLLVRRQQGEVVPVPLLLLAICYKDCVEKSTLKTISVDSPVDPNWMAVQVSFSKAYSRQPCGEFTADRRFSQAENAAV